MIVYIIKIKILTKLPIYKMIEKGMATNKFHMRIAV
jgi:hypothetical protein